MIIEVRHIRMVQAIVQEGTMTRAANRLHVTQPAVSHLLKNLEDQLGSLLFQRNGKRMQLTPAGQQLFNAAESILSQLQRVEDLVRQTSTGQGGLLRISTECYTCYHWLPSRLKAFRQRFPKVDVRIVVEATRRPIEFLLNGKLDIAISCSPPRNNKLEFKPLFVDEILAVTNPEHPWASKPYVGPEDFLDQNLLLYAVPKEEMNAFRDVFFPARVFPTRIAHVELTEAVLEMVKAGLGVTLLSRWAVAHDLRAGKLVGLPLTRGGYRRQWYAVMAKMKNPPPYLKEFVTLLARYPITDSTLRTDQKSHVAHPARPKSFGARSRTPQCA
jgi:LysR family transcriptional regulator for metE and metH